MSSQGELFTLPSGFQPDDKRPIPAFWVRELRIYRSFSPAEAELLRKIELRPGLNILWAKPRERTKGNAQRTAGVSGHATGKTTFCRFLRYVLGETAFGTEEQRTRLREKFPQGFVVAEIHIDGEPWLVRRPFRVGGAPHLAFRGRMMDRLFEEDDDHERAKFDDYRQHLNRVLAEPLPVSTFATAPTPIEWPHLIQWLTRDQECRFAGMAELRHASSESQSPNMVAEDIHFLFRAVIGLVDTEEQAEIEKNKEYLRRKQDAEQKAPLFKFRSESAYERLRKRLSDFRADLNVADFLVAVEKEWGDQAKASTSELAALQEPGAVELAREELVKVSEEFHRIHRRKGQIEWTLEGIEQELKSLRGGKPSDFDEWLKKVPSEYECGHTLAEAIEWECPLAAGRALPIEGNKKDIPVGTRIEQLERQQIAERAKLANLQTIHADGEKKVASVRDALKRELAKFDKIRADLAKQQAEDEAVAAEATRAIADKTESDRLEASLKDWEQKIRTSQGLQNQIRSQQSSALSAFSQTFARVAKFIVDDEVRGTIRFSGRKVDPALNHEIDLTSAALVTLKIICFDLAALISSVEGRGAHPRFLVHDGPREADMDAEIYQRIFELVKELEDEFKEQTPNFQYIITTTEPPPEALRVRPWLLEPTLDASTQEGKLLGENF